MKYFIIVVVVSFLSFPLSGQNHGVIDDVYAITFMPDGNSVIGIAKRSDGIKLRVWDISIPTQIIETTSIRIAENEEKYVKNNEYRLSTSSSGNLVAVSIRPKKKSATKIQIYNITDGSLATSIDIQSVIEPCRHALTTLEFSSDDRYIYFSDFHGNFRFNLSESKLEPILSNKEVIMIAFDSNRDIPVASGIKETVDGICPDKEYVYEINNENKVKIDYTDIRFNHNHMMPAIEAKQYLNLQGIDKWVMKVYMKSDTTKKFLAFRKRGKKIDGKFVTDSTMLIEVYENI